MKHVLVTTALMLASLVLVASGSAQQAENDALAAEPPRREFVIIVSGGDVATSRGKATVNLMVLVHTDRTLTALQMMEDAAFGAEVHVAAQHSPDIADALREAVTHAENRRAINQQIGSLSVTVAPQGMAIPEVVLTVDKDDEFSMQARSITLTIDNATSLAGLIERLERNRLWLEPRLPMLRLDSELPMTVGDE